VKTDSLFYRLFQQLPTLVFDLIGLRVPDADSYRFGSEEVKQTAFRLDGVLFPPVENRRQPLLFVEVQFQPDKAFYGRFFSEIFLYLRHHKPGNPWQAVVIYPNRRIEENSDSHYDELLEGSRVHRVYLEEFTNEETNNIGVNLLQLIAIEEKRSVARAFTLVERVRNEPVDVQWKNQMLDLIETIMVYKLPRLDRGEIQRMLNINDVELKQTRFYQDVFAEGRQEGKQEGKQEGRQEGKQEGEAGLVIRQLTRRLGPLDPAAVERIRALPVPKIEALAEALLDFSERDDLDGWLKAQAE